MNNTITISAKLHLSNDTTFEGIVSQIQKETNDYLLAVEDGTTLKVYTDSKDYPKDLTFENYKVRNGIIEYYFRDNEDTGNLFAVFGKENANKFCPSYQNNIDIPFEEEEEVLTREETSNKHDESDSSSSSDLSSDNVKIEVISHDGLSDTKFNEIINDENNMFPPRGSDIPKIQDVSNNDDLKEKDSTSSSNESKTQDISNNEDSKDDSITVTNESKVDTTLTSEPTENSIKLNEPTENSILPDELKDENIEPGNNIVENIGPDVIIESKEESNELPQEIPNNILNVENNPDENLIVTLLST